MSTQTMPYAELHRRLGASFAPYRGFDAPAFYTTADEEYDVIRQGCGVLDRSISSRYEMLGEDRARFLNGLVTRDIKELEVGQGVYGFIPDVKGRILVDFAALALDDRLWLEWAPGKGEEIAEHLQKYVIVDRVELQPLDQVPLSLMGPGSEALLEDCAERPKEWRSHVATEIFGVPIRLVREPDLAVSTWSLWVPPDRYEEVFERFLEVGGDAIRPVGFDAIERLRIEESRPMYGRDYDSSNFPQETGLGKVVSYTKGCYLGQEVIARIHYRGGVNRQLRGLIFAGDQPAARHIGHDVLHEDRKAGTVTSATDATDGRRLGLAILHKRVEPGMTVTLDEGGSAEVVELPF